MASLAAMLKSRGHHVWGSDENVYPPMSTFLADQQIEVLQGFDEAHLQANRPDLVIVGNAMSRGNSEVEYVLNEKIAYLSMPAALGQKFIKDYYSCVVTGTHGKTTTSSILAWILESADANPGFFIAGIPENFQRGFQLGEGRYFVSEGDEYDSAFFDKGPKFLHYRPDLAIINNIEFDHADIYNNLEEIKTSFRRMINIIPGNGHIVANADDPVVTELIAMAYSNVHSFGLSPSATWRAVDLEFGEAGSRFIVLKDGQKYCELTTPLFGEYNVRNVLAAFVSATILEIPLEKIQDGLSSFKGVRRRMTQIADINKVLIFEDFAHHATAVRETLKGVRQRFPNRRIVAVFEPRTASAKRKVFENQYYAAFDEADQIILAPMHMPEKAPASERMSVENIVNALNKKGKTARSFTSNDAVLNCLAEGTQSKDIVVFMSNGNFDRLPHRLAATLNNTTLK